MYAAQFMAAMKKVVMLKLQSHQEIYHLFSHGLKRISGQKDVRFQRMN